MRSVVFAFTFTLYLVLCVPVAECLDIPQCPSPQTCDNDPGHLEAFVKSFYTWYVVSIFENNESWDSGPLKKKFQSMLTPRLFREVRRKMEDPDWDSDPITCTQDYNYTWFYPIVKAASIQGNKRAAFIIDFPQPPLLPYELNVTLKPSNGLWLIEDVGGKNCGIYHGR